MYKTFEENIVKETISSQIVVESDLESEISKLVEKHFKKASSEEAKNSKDCWRALWGCS